MVLQNGLFFRCCVWGALLFFTQLALAATGEVEFVRNDGQWEENVRFRADIGGGRIYVENDRLTFQMSEADQIHRHHTAAPVHTNHPEVLGAFAYQVIFEEASPDVSLRGDGKSAAYHNYFTGNDATRWRAGVPLFTEVIYEGLYEGIDLRLLSRNELLEYDFIVSPGGDPSKIRMKYQGVETLRLKDGQLLLYTPLGTVTELAPVAFQEENGARKTVPARFVLRDDGSVAFDVSADYDPNRPLIIDPVLVFSTYTGSHSDNWGFSATYDREGNLYAGGMCSGQGYPVTIGAYDTIYSGGDIFISSDIAISKFSPDGTSLIYATYLGGAANEIPHSLIVNEHDELLIYGTTGSDDYPVTANAFDNSFNGGTDIVPASSIGYSNGSDIVITRMNREGSNILASTYFGGTGNDGINTTGSSSLEYNYGDFARGDITVAPDGDILIASCTFSDDLPIGNGTFQTSRSGELDGLVARFSPDLQSLRWANYVGGSENDAVYSIELTGEENIMLGGGTASSDFPAMTGYDATYNGGQADGFILELTADGQGALSGTFLGTNRYDQAYFIELGRDGYVYAFGQTLGAYPVTSGQYSVNNASQFIHKFSPDLQDSEYSQLFGSPAASSNNKQVNISPTAFLVDNCQNIYAIGWGGATNLNYNLLAGTTFGMELTADAYQIQTDGNDFYLMVLENDGADLLYSTYFGEIGGGGDHVDGGTSRFDKRGFVYHASCASCGGTDNFPTTDGAWSEDNLSNNCNLAAFKFEFDFAPIAAAIDADPVSGCPPLEVQFSNFSNIEGEYYFWDFDDGTTSDTENPFHVFDELGTYNVQLIIVDSSNCSISDTAHIQIVVTDSDNTVAALFESQDSICSRDNIVFENLSENANNYLWDFGDGTTSTDFSPMHTFTAAGTYTVMLVADPGSACSDTFQLPITLFNNTLETMIDVFVPSCSDTTLTVFFNDFSSGNYPIETWEWDFGDGTFADTSSVQHQFPASGTYTVGLTVTDAVGCSAYVSEEVQVSSNQFTAHFDWVTSCDPLMNGVQFNDLSGGDFDPVNWTWDFGDGNQSDQQNPLWFFGSEGTYTVTLTIENSLGCEASVTEEVTVEFQNVPISFEVDSLECNNPRTVFINNSLGNPNITGYQWDFGDGSVSADPEPVYTYASPGNYTVTLTATTSLGCTAIYSTQVVHPELTVDFNVVPNIGCYLPGQSIQFIVFGESSAGINLTTWDFGDGTVESNLFSTSHIYSAPGTYDVEYLITNSDGCVDTSAATIVVADTIDVPVMVDPQSCRASDIPVFFQADLSDFDPGTQIEWDFGDGVTETAGDSITHVYSDNGLYTVTATVLNPGACPGLAVFEIELSFEEIDPSFSVGIMPGCSGAEVTFSDQTTSSGDVVNWMWDFGDGTTSEQQNPLHIYSVSGTYSVTLTATTSGGCSQTFTADVSVDDPGSVELPDALEVCEGESVLLPLTGDFGTGFTWTPSQLLDDASLQQPTASPVQDTWFAVTVTEMLPTGEECVQADSVFVTVNALPFVEASASQTLVAPGTSVDLQATSGYVSYSWSPADLLDDPAISNPTAVIDSDILFEVTVADQNGCVATDTVQIRTTYEDCDFSTLFIPNAFSPNGDGVNDRLFVRLQGLYDRVDFRVYNRWGEEVFSTGDISIGWDGRWRDQLQSTDVFGYFLEVECAGEIVQRKGNVTLVR